MVSICTIFFFIFVITFPHLYQLQYPQVLINNTLNISLYLFWENINIRILLKYLPGFRSTLFLNFTINCHRNIVYIYQMCSHNKIMIFWFNFVCEEFNRQKAPKKQKSINCVGGEIEKVGSGWMSGWMDGLMVWKTTVGISHLLVYWALHWVKWLHTVAGWWNAYFVSGIRSRVFKFATPSGKLGLDFPWPIKSLGLLSVLSAPLRIPIPRWPLVELIKYARTGGSYPGSPACRLCPWIFS